MAFLFLQCHQNRADLMALEEKASITLLLLFCFSKNREPLTLLPLYIGIFYIAIYIYIYNTHIYSFILYALPSLNINRYNYYYHRRHRQFFLLSCAYLYSNNDDHKNRAYHIALAIILNLCVVHIATSNSENHEGPDIAPRVVI